MKKSHLALLLFTLVFSSVGLWTLLSLYTGVGSTAALQLPAFTRLLMEWRWTVLFLPVPLAVYSIAAFLRPGSPEGWARTISLGSVAALAVAFFPILWAVILPCVKLMDQTWTV